MPVDCQRSTSGGKGNNGMFIERDRRVCAAGLPTAQPDETVGDLLRQYLMQDEVDSLMSDAVFPPKKPRPLPPLRHPIPVDKRFAAASYTDVAGLVNPQPKTKFQELAEDLKNTVYSSYWKSGLGSVADPVPRLPEGFDTFNTTFGRKNPFLGTLYDIVMPKDPMPDKTPRAKGVAAQVNRNYCESFKPDLTYGHRTNVDKRGTYARCCLTDDRITTGTADRAIMNSVQAVKIDSSQPRLGEALTPNDNIKDVPPDYSFGKLGAPGNVPECLIYCNINKGKDDFRKCFGHLNSLRKCLRTRYLPGFFHTLYLKLKYFDKEKTGWLPKDIVYEFCGSQMLRFKPSFLEPLLEMWHAFDGSRIEYKTFVHMINYREPSPTIPKIYDVEPSCLDYRTTYTEMVKSGQTEVRNWRAGLPSGRYFDMDYPVTPENCCRADRTNLPHESDMRSCLCPSILTLTHVTHRDMFARRDPETVRKVFENAGEKFTDESFDKIWKEAMKYNSMGWVCFETFRKALNDASISDI